MHLGPPNDDDTPLSSLGPGPVALMVTDPTPRGHPRERSGGQTTEKRSGIVDGPAVRRHGGHVASKRIAKPPQRCPRLQLRVQHAVVADSRARDDGVRQDGESRRMCPGDLPSVKGSTCSFTAACAGSARISSRMRPKGRRGQLGHAGLDAVGVVLDRRAAAAGPETTNPTGCGPPASELGADLAPSRRPGCAEDDKRRLAQRLTGHRRARRRAGASTGPWARAYENYDQVIRPVAVRRSPVETLASRGTPRRPCRPGERPARAGAPSYDLWTWGPGPPMGHTASARLTFCLELGPSAGWPLAEFCAAPATARVGSII